MRPEVAWTVPISLGDSHRGHRVLGTTPAYFEHYRYGRKQPLVLAEGRPFEDGPGSLVLAPVGEACPLLSNGGVIAYRGVIHPKRKEVPSGSPSGSSAMFFESGKGGRLPAKTRQHIGSSSWFNQRFPNPN